MPGKMLQFPATAARISHYEIERISQCVWFCTYRDDPSCRFLHTVTGTLQYTRNCLATLIGDAATVKELNKQVYLLIENAATWLAQNAKDHAFLMPGANRVSWAMPVDFIVRDENGKQLGDIWPEAAQDLMAHYPDILRHLGFRFRYVTLDASGTAQKGPWIE